jgi:peptide deformylase
MPARKLIHYGHPTLRKKAKLVTRPDSVLLRLAEDIILTMHEEGGVGLAAPQVDAPVSLMVYDLSTKDISVDPVVLFNPKIVENSETEWEIDEGCLSIPEIRHLVRRPAGVTVEAMDIHGKPVIIKHAEGMLGRVLLHEIDHLNGMFFVDRLTDDQKKEIQAALKKLEKATRRKLKL